MFAMKFELYQRRLAACPYNYDYTSTRREKCMEYIRYDIVYPMLEPRVKSTGARIKEKR